MSQRRRVSRALTRRFAAGLIDRFRPAVDDWGDLRAANPNLAVPVAARTAVGARALATGWDRGGAGIMLGLSGPSVHHMSPEAERGGERDRSDPSVERAIQYVRMWAGLPVCSGLNDMECP